ncbi:MAG: leucine-rich repeat domain-containing protein, partial [Bacteroidetes bacterium]|nr:leucine-rich repeat domain-containing protein [Bacteroidota bacterium]
MEKGIFNYIGDNHKTLPEEVFQHPENVRILLLTSNSIQILPAVIGRLVNLEKLDLSSNQLSELPPEIGQLRKLRYLDLSDNQLETIPEVIGELKDLQVLDLSYNQLPKLPPSLGKLEKLEKLRLRRNHIEDLPLDLANYFLAAGNLKELDLRDNPVEKNLPKNINQLSSGLEKLQTHVDQTISRSFLSEVKIVFMGGGERGKTSLINRLLNRDDETRTTMGIDIYEVGKSSEGKKKDIQRKFWKTREGKPQIKVNIWDFGGQRVQHDIHRFFLSHRTLYVIVTSGQAIDSGGPDGIEYWLRHLRPLSEKAEEKKSPIVVVVNKIDREYILVDEDRLAAKVPKVEVRDYVYTSTMPDYNHTIEILKEKLQLHLYELQDSEVAIPTYWLEVRDNINEQKKLGKHYITFDELEAIVNQVVKKKIERPEICKLIDTLNNVGVIVKFEKNREEIFILDPNWIVLAVYQVMLHPAVKEHHGIVSVNLIEQKLILDGHFFDYSTREDKKRILELMRIHDLCFPLTDDEEPQFLIPYYLESKEPPFSLDPRLAEDIPLKLRFNYHESNDKDFTDFIDSVIWQFIARNYEYIQDRRAHCWKYGVYLSNFENTPWQQCVAKLFKDKYEKEIHLEIYGPSDAKHILLREIREKLETINEMIVNEIIKCEIPVTQHWIGYEDLIQARESGRTSIYLPGMGADIDVQKELAPYEGPAQPTEADLQKIQLRQFLEKCPPARINELFEREERLWQRLKKID